MTKSAVKNILTMLHNSPYSDVKISKESVDYAYKVVNVFTEDILDHLQPTDIYSTFYDSVIFEWLDSNYKSFSLETGYTNFSYSLIDDAEIISSGNNLTLVKGKKKFLNELSKFVAH